MIPSVIDSSLIKKRVRFNFSRISLQLDLSEALFSSFDVDLGTKILLNSLRKDKFINFSKILDLGCGYGPIGLFLKAQDSSRIVHMVDRDALAVAFSLHNAHLNDLDVCVFPSLDYEQVEEKYSLIITNFPAKIERKGLETFIYSASEHLINDGILALVVVRELTKDLEDLLHNQPINIRYRENKAGYSILHISFNKKIPRPEKPYERAKITVKFSKKYSVKTAFGLPEFDKLNFGTIALHHLLRENKNPCFDSVLMFEPGQGHGAIATMESLKPTQLVLASRDLLSLTFAARNVRSNFSYNPNKKHIPYLKNIGEKLIVWNVQRKSDLALNAYNLGVLLGEEIPFVVYGQTSLLRKLLRNKDINIVNKTLHKRYSALLLMPS